MELQKKQKKIQFDDYSTYVMKYLVKVLSVQKAYWEIKSIALKPYRITFYAKKVPHDLRETQNHTN